MTNFVISATTTTGQTLAAGEIGTVLAGAALSVAFGDAVTAGSNSSLTVGGLINGRSVDVGATDAINLDVLSTGALFGDIGVFVNTSVSGSTFSTFIGNAGAITGLQAGIWLLGHDATILNTGSISAASNGIIAHGISLDLSNSGTIFGFNGVVGDFGTVMRLVNTGSILATGSAIASGNMADSITNSGVIHGQISLGGSDDQFDGHLGKQFTVYGGDGNDSIAGGAANEYLSGDAGNDVLHGNGGDDAVYGGLGNDLVYGNQGDDDLHGLDGVDFLYGGQGDDSLSGGLGADSLYGGEGDDYLTGDTGNDVLRGGHGDDTLNGGAGADRFVFVRNGGDDVVQDFQNGLDKVNLAAFGFFDFTSLTANAHDTSAGLFIDLSFKGGGSVTVFGLTMALFDATDVIL